MNGRPLALVAVAVASLAVACSGDDDGGGQDAAVDEELVPYADALAASFAADTDFSLAAAESSCFADRAVVIVGLDRLRTVGDPDAVVAATTDDLSALDLGPDDTRALAEAMVGCDPGLLDRVRGDLAGAGVTLDATQQECVNGLVDGALLLDSLDAGFAGEDATAPFGPVIPDIAACLR